MYFKDVLQQVHDLPLFQSDYLKVGDVNSVNLQKQLSRWTDSGKLDQLRRGLYVLAEPYRNRDPHPFLIANQLLSPSYVSLQSALSYYELIPEAVPETTCITSRRRTTSYETKYGTFLYQVVQKDLFMGFSLVEVALSQQVYLARPEKALLDLIYLTARGDQMPFLESLRLQNTEQLDLSWMLAFTQSVGKDKLVTAVNNLAQLLESEEYIYL